MTAASAVGRPPSRLRSGAFATSLVVASSILQSADGRPVAHPVATDSGSVPVVDRFSAPAAGNVVLT